MKSKITVLFLMVICLIQFSCQKTAGDLGGPAGKEAMDLIRKNDSEALGSFLMEHPAFVALTDDQGNTLLHKAAFRGSLNVIDTLIDSGADVNAKNKAGSTPLHELVNSGDFRDTERIQAGDLLIDAGADVNAVDNSEETPLFGAVNTGKKELVRSMLEHGADPNVTSMRYNKSALARAVEQQRDEIAELLRAYGAAE